MVSRNGKVHNSAGCLFYFKKIYFTVQWTTKKAKKTQKKTKKNKKQKTTTTTTTTTTKKQKKKIGKYSDLAREPKKLRKVTMIPIIISVLRTIPKGLVNQRMSGDHPGDQRKVANAQTPVKDH